MRILRDTTYMSPDDRGATAAIGNFDGVHLGHQAVLKIAADAARAPLGVVTFEPHPRRVLQPERGLRLLETFDQKMETLEELGLDAVVAEPFDRDFARPLDVE